MTSNLSWGWRPLSHESLASVCKVVEAGECSWGEFVLHIFGRRSRWNLLYASCLTTPAETSRPNCHTVQTFARFCAYVWDCLFLVRPVRSRPISVLSQHGTRTPEDPVAAEERQKAGRDEEGEGPRSEDRRQSCPGVHLLCLQGKFKPPNSEGNQILWSPTPTWLFGFGKLSSF